MKQSEFEMSYPLAEGIGDADLYVERREVTAEYEQWISRIPKKRSKSRAILARPKSGKRAFIQRVFNRLWGNKEGKQGDRTLKGKQGDRTLKSAPKFSCVQLRLKLLPLALLVWPKKT